LLNKAPFLVDFTSVIFRCQHRTHPGASNILVWGTGMSEENAELYTLFKTWSIYYSRS